MILDSTSKSLQFKLSAVVSTNQLTCVASWADMSGSTFTPGSTTSVSNGTTAVIIVAAPGASTQRQVKGLDIFNADTTAATVIVQYDDSTNTRTLVEITLQPNETLQLSDDAWSVIDSGGRAQISSGSTTLAGDTDVNISSPTNGQVLEYNSSTSKWVNGAGSGGSSSAWQFSVSDYGAVGDGKIGTGGTGSSGSNAFSDTSASFTTADIGKAIIVNQGTTGSNTTPFTGSIAGFTDSHHVTLSGNLTANASNAPYIYGTDDVAAINAAVAAATTWAEANTQKVQVLFDAKYYMLAALTQQASPNPHYNCHIPLPFAAENAQKLQLELVGAGFSPATQFWQGETPQMAGTHLISAITPNPFQPDATWGQITIIGAPSNGFSSVGFVNAMYIIDGITLVTPYNSPMGGIDCMYATQLSVPSGRATTFCPVNLPNASIGGPNLTSSALPTNDVAIAYKFPRFLNNAFNYVGYLIVEGWSIAIDAGEHFQASYFGAYYCDRAFQIDTPAATPGTHGFTVQHASVEQCNHAIYVLNGNSGAMCPINFGLLDMEDIFVDHVNDANNNLVGIVYWNNLTATHPVVSGAENLTVINTTRNLPGPWSGAPAAPSSDSAQQNVAYRFATVYVSATTSVTNAATGQASTGLTATGQSAGAGEVVPIRVNPGAYYSVTYTGTLTTNWVLE